MDSLHKEERDVTDLFSVVSRNLTAVYKRKQMTGDELGAVGNGDAR